MVTTTNTFVVTDGAGLTATCSFDVTVNDTEDPAITCPADITTSNDTGDCTAVVTYTTPVGTDNCTGATTTQTAGLPSGSAFPVGVTTNTFEVTDAAGNSTTCSFTVTVNDTEDPAITCPADITVTGTSSAGAVVTYTTPVGTDNCTGATTTQTAGLPSGSTFPLGTTTNTFEVEDTSGNTTSCSFTVEVTGVPPSIVCPADIVVDNDSGNCDAIVTFAATETTGVPASVITYSQDPGTAFPVGVTTVTATATNAVGTSQCTFTITVNDTEDPAITCPADITTSNDTGDCSAVVTYTTPVGTDNCTGATTTQTAGLPSGSAFPVGTTTNTFVVTDGAGLTATCSFDVTVNDTEDPAITCPADIIVNNDSGSCDAVVNFVIDAVDNCSGGSGLNEDFESGPNGWTTGSLGAANNWLISDNSGENFPFGNLMYGVPHSGDFGHENSFLLSPVFDSTGGGDFEFDYFVNNEDDPYDQEIVQISYNGGASWTSVIGTQLPNNPSSIQSTSFNISSANGTANTRVRFIYDTIDGCCGPQDGFWVDNINFGGSGGLVVTTSPSSGDTFPVGVTTVTATATDEAGNTSTCSFTVTVNDTEDPTISCPLDITVNNDTGDCDALVTYSVTTNDNCPGETLIQTAGLSSGSEFPVGITTNTFEVTDAAGNTATCSFDVTVNDTEDPTWVIPPSDLTVECDGSGNVAEFDNWLNSTFTGTDNCTGVTVTNDSSGLSDDCGATGTETVTFTLTDSNGNSTTLQATFTIVDTTNPTMDVAASDLIIQCDVDNSAEIDAWLANNGGASASDSCSAVIWTNDFTTVNEDVCGALTTVTFTATDECGNVTTTEANINTEDTIPPVIGCPGDVTAVTEDGDCGAIVNFQPAEAIDNCGTAIVYQTGGLGSGSVFPVGDTLIEYTAQDECGNLATCTFTVTVIDDDAPVAICQDIIVILDDTGNATITADQLNFGSIDNCGVGSLDIDMDTFDCSNVGANEVTLTVTDIHGNTATCVATVTVLDLTDPIAVCQDITVELGNDGTVTIDPLDVDGGSSDACGIASYELNIDTLDCSNLGNTTVILTVTDANGNQSSCSATITLEDNTPLELVCNDITVELNQDGVAFITPSLVADVIDGCGTSTVTVDVEEVSCSDIGSPVTVNVFANDGNGNSAVCSSIVTVVDLLAPEIVCPDDQVVNLNADGTYTLGDYIADGSATATDNCTDPVTIFSQDPASGTSLGLGVQVVTFTAEDEYGNVSTCSFELDVQDILGNNNTEDFASLVLYPNPADSKVNLSNPRQIDLNNVTIYDVTGRIVNKVDLRTMGSEITIDISTLANATYMLVIKGSQGTSTKQLIVNNY